MKRTGSASPVLPAGLQHVRVDQDIVPGNIRVIGGDVANPAHISREVIDLVDALGRLLAVLPKPQVQQLKLVGRTGLEFRCLNIDAPDPKSVRFQAMNQVVADKSPGARDQNARFSLHADSNAFQLGWRTLILSDVFAQGQANTRIRKGKR
jgi:hypothetical protein